MNVDLIIWAADNGTVAFDLWPHGATPVVDANCLVTRQGYTGEGRARHAARCYAERRDWTIVDEDVVLDTK